MKEAKMTGVEKEQWDKLYEYVKKEILLYDENQSLTRQFCLRLRGLTFGKYLDNNNIKNKANYTFEIVLYTFQICKPHIIRAVSNKVFKSENDKFNYICKIVENNINDVYLRVQKAKKSQENVERLDTKILSYKGGKYQKKTEELKNKKLEELW